MCEKLVSRAVSKNTRFSDRDSRTRYIIIIIMIKYEYIYIYIGTNRVQRLYTVGLVLLYYVGHHAAMADCCDVIVAPWWRRGKKSRSKIFWNKTAMENATATAAIIWCTLKTHLRYSTIHEFCATRRTINPRARGVGNDDLQPRWWIGRYHLHT